MRVDQFPALAAHGDAATSLGSLSRRATVRATAQRAAAATREICAILGASGATVMVVGVVMAAACTLWAVRLDVPYQVALLAGYITLAATACICAALVAVRYSAPGRQAVAGDSAPALIAAPAAIAPPEDVGAPDIVVAPQVFAEAEALTASAAAAAPVAPAEIDEILAGGADAAPEVGERATNRTPPRREPRPKSGIQHAEPKIVSLNSEPDYAAWQHVGALRVADAARLWCGVAPGAHATAAVMEWAATILEAIDRGELPKSQGTAILAQYKNGWHTEIQRDALLAWAKSKGHAPRFLDDQPAH